AGRGRGVPGVARDRGAAGPERARRVDRAGRRICKIRKVFLRLGQGLVVLLLGEIDLRLDVLFRLVHGNKNRAPMAQTQALYSSTSTASAVRQARCWPPSTAIVTPVTLAASAR